MEHWGDEEGLAPHSRRKREVVPAALDLIERYTENIVPLITCTILIYILVLITLPLLFCGEHTCFSGLAGDEDEEEGKELNENDFLKDDGDEDTFHIDKSLVPGNLKEFIRFVYTFNIPQEGDSLKQCTCNGREPQPFCPCHGGGQIIEGSSDGSKQSLTSGDQIKGCPCPEPGSNMAIHGVGSSVGGGGAEEDDNELRVRESRREVNIPNMSSTKPSKSGVGGGVGRGGGGVGGGGAWGGGWGGSTFPSCEEGPSEKVPCAPPIPWLQWDWDDPCCGCNEDFVAKRLKETTWSQLAQYVEASYEEEEEKAAESNNRGQPEPSRGQEGSAPEGNSYLQWFWNSSAACGNEEFVGRRLKEADWSQLLNYAQGECDTSVENINERQRNQKAPSAIKSSAIKSSAIKEPMSEISFKAAKSDASLEPSRRENSLKPATSETQQEEDIVITLVETNNTKEMAKKIEDSSKLADPPTVISNRDIDVDEKEQVEEGGKTSALSIVSLDEDK